MQDEKLIHMISECERYLKDNVQIQTFGRPIHTVTFIADYPCSIIKYDTWYEISDHAFFQYNRFSVAEGSEKLYKRVTAPTTKVVGFHES